VITLKEVLTATNASHIKLTRMKVYLGGGLANKGWTNHDIDIFIKSGYGMIVSDEDKPEYLKDQAELDRLLNILHAHFHSRVAGLEDFKEHRYILDLWRDAWAPLCVEES